MIPPPGMIQILLSAVLTVVCGITIMLLWRWYIVPIGLPKIGFVNAIGIDMFVTFITTAEVKEHTTPYLNRWVTNIIFALTTLVLGWVFHFFM